MTGPEYGRASGQHEYRGQQSELFWDGDRVRRVDASWPNNAFHISAACAFFTHSDRIDILDPESVCMPRCFTCGAVPWLHDPDFFHRDEPEEKQCPDCLSWFTTEECPECEPRRRDEYLRDKAGDDAFEDSRD